MSSKSAALALLVLAFMYEIVTINHNVISVVSEKITQTLMK